MERCYRLLVEIKKLEGQLAEAQREVREAEQAARRTALAKSKGADARRKAREKLADAQMRENALREKLNGLKAKLPEVLRRDLADISRMIDEESREIRVAMRRLEEEITRRAAELCVLCENRWGQTFIEGSRGWRRGTPSLVFNDRHALSSLPGFHAAFSELADRGGESPAQAEQALSQLTMMKTKIAFELESGVGDELVTAALLEFLNKPEDLTPRQLLRALSALKNAA